MKIFQHKNGGLLRVGHKIKGVERVAGSRVHRLSLNHIERSDAVGQGPAIQLFAAIEGYLTKHVFNAPLFPGDNVDDGILGPGQNIQFIDAV